MDINYNIETEMCSLRKMCIGSVTQNILEIARRDPSTMDIPKSIASKAAEMVPELDLPQTLTTEIVAIIRPVMEEMLHWYERYGDVVRVILTPHGTVDWTRSARAIAASDQPIYQRYVTACEYCLEDEIFTLGKQVTSVMLREQFNPCAEFWYDVYGGNFKVKIIGGSLSQEQVVEGWFFAGLHRKISMMKYFQEKATSKSIQVILYRIWDDTCGCPDFLSITPTLCNTCLHDKVVDDEWLEGKKGTISTFMLLPLINYPYQHLFLESAELLMPNLTESHFWYIAYFISGKLSAGYKDYAYKGLFVRFWNLGLSSFKSKLLVCSSESIIQKLLDNLFLVKDEFLVCLVFDQILQTDEDAIVSKLIHSFLCYSLFYGEALSECLLPYMRCGLLSTNQTTNHVEAYDSIEFLMSIIRAKYRNFFFKFQNAFNSEHDEVHRYIQNITWMLNNHDYYLDKYVQFMSKYWVLPELELLGKNDLV